MRKSAVPAMPVEFSLWKPDFLPLHRKAYDYLDKACQRSQLGILTPEDTIEQARRGRTSIYIVIEQDQIIGCFTLSLRPSSNDLYLELPLLGGERIREWRDQLVEFILALGAKHSCTKFVMIGRKGFDRIFPELTLLTCVYGRNLTEPF